MRHYLFMCSQNKWRSPTAEHIFADVPGIATLSAGMNNDAENPLTDEVVEWADVIFVMERQHRSKLQSKHKAMLCDKRVVVLDIPDEYGFMEESLVRLLRSRMKRWLPDG